MVFQADVLRVQRLAIRGLARLPTAEVERLVEGLRGEHILQVDFERYRRRIMESPWVADVTLWRVLPATIEIRVTERVPMAIARLGQQLYLVDRTGVIIGQFSPEYRDLDLSVVDGLIESATAGQSPVEPGRVRLASALIDALDTRPDLRDRLSQIDVSNALDAVVMFDDDPAWLHLGDTRFVERLQTYLDLRPTLRTRFRDVDYVDLRFDERVYLNGRPAAAAPAANPGGAG
jgi:cell division protein FtsQ